MLNKIKNLYVEICKHVKILYSFTYQLVDEFEGVGWKENLAKWWSWGKRGLQTSRATRTRSSGEDAMIFYQGLYKTKND